jgi:uncharacterized protein YlbG (UPF0298 family)
MAQKEDLRKEFLKIRREFNEKVKSKQINFFSKENLNKKEKGMLSIKFQIGRLDWLIIYVDKDKKEILEKLTTSTNTNQIEKTIMKALENNYKGKIIFNLGTRNEIIIEYDGKETFEKYSKYTFELTQQLRSASIEV